MSVKFYILWALLQKHDKIWMIFAIILFLSNAMNECVEQMIKIEKEYEEAVLNEDDEI